MNDLQAEPLKKEIIKQLENGVDVSSIIEKYDIKDKADHQSGKPTRATLYNWRDKVRELKNIRLSNSVKFDKNFTGEPNSTPPPSPKTEPSQDEFITFTSGTPPEIPKGYEDQQKSAQEFQKPISEEEIIEFDLMSEEVPNLYKQGLVKRGFTEDDFTKINYSRYEEVQKRTTSKVVKKYMPQVVPWALEINCATSYIMPAILGGLIVRDRKKGKKEEQKQESKQEQGMQSVGFVYSSNIGKVDMERN